MSNRLSVRTIPASNNKLQQRMLQQPFRKTFDIGDGREVTIETGRLARQADG